MKVKNKKNLWVLYALSCVFAFSSGLLLNVLVRIVEAKNVSKQILLEGIMKERAMGEYNFTILVLVGAFVLTIMGTILTICNIYNSKK